MNRPIDGPADSMAPPSALLPASRTENLLRILSGEDQILSAQLTRAGLWLLTPLYGLVITAYRGMYDLGMLKEVRLPCPVVSIGNLTTGGTGKTALALYLARLFQKHGLTPALLNYGYHAGIGRGPAIVSDGHEVLLTPAEAGDEAVLLANSLPGVPVLIGKRRIESGALAIERFHPDLLLLDDAFQYWRLARNVNLVLMNAASPWGYNAILPRGLLRELPFALKRATGVVLTHTNRVGKEEIQILERDIRRIAPRLPIFHANYRPQALRPLHSSQHLPLCEIKGKRVGAMSGLGSPKTFEQGLLELEAVEVTPYRFPDHHAYQTEEITRVLQDAKQNGLYAVITTAKDAVKLESLGLNDISERLWVLEVELVVEPEEEFRSWMMGQLRAVLPK